MAAGRGILSENFLRQFRDKVSTLSMLMEALSLEYREKGARPHVNIVVQAMHQHGDDDEKADKYLLLF